MNDFARNIGLVDGLFSMNAGPKGKKYLVSLQRVGTVDPSLLVRLSYTMAVMPDKKQALYWEKGFTFAELENMVRYSPRGFCRSKPVFAEKQSIAQSNPMERLLFIAAVRFR